jgi:guanylate kinase
MKGTLIVITGPSGVGKTTIVDALLARLPSAARLVTTTTRSPRPGEADGSDYHFVAREEFERRIGRGDFLEWAETYGNLYGSSRPHVEALRDAHDVVFAIVDLKGARAIKAAMPDAVTVCLVAPIEQIRERLLRRKKEMPEDELRRRIAEIEAEMSQARSFDHAVECLDGHLYDAAVRITSIIDR